jgi:hypothetical protein
VRPKPVEDREVALCACGHPLDHHDAIATRFCDATLAAALPRGCICKPLSPGTG